MLVCEVAHPSALPAVDEAHKDKDEALAGLRSAISLRKPALLAAAIVAADKCIEPIPGTTTSYNFEDMTLPRLLPAARWHYTFLMNHATRDTRIVLWTKGNGSGSPRPGLFCPDAATARFALQSVAPALVRLCANPRCRIPFYPNNTRQTHHHPSCRVAAKRARTPAMKKTQDT